MEPWQNTVDSFPPNVLSCPQPTLQTLHSIQILDTDISQGVANTLAYLQYHLHKVSEQQDNSETNINNTLSTLTTQLQQLIQLVLNSLYPLTPVITLPLLPVISTSPLVASRSQAYPKLSSPLDFHKEQSSGHAFLNSCILYIYLVLEQFSCKKKSALGTDIL